MRMHEYSITFAADVDRAATAIERQAADSTVRRNAALWRVRAIREMRKACFRLAPVGALVDAWIVARQMDQLCRDGAGAGAFGTFQPEPVEVSRRLVQQMREIGGSIAVSPQATIAFEHKFIDPWLTEHPLSDITLVRESPMGRFADSIPHGWRHARVRRPRWRNWRSASHRRPASPGRAAAASSGRSRPDALRDAVSRKCRVDAARLTRERDSRGSHRVNRRRHFGARPERATNCPGRIESATTPGNGRGFRRAGTSGQTRSSARLLRNAAKRGHRSERLKALSVSDCAMAGHDGVRRDLLPERCMNSVTPLSHTREPHRQPERRSRWEVQKPSSAVAYEPMLDGRFGPKIEPTVAHLISARRLGAAGECNQCGKDGECSAFHCHPRE
jgi:hypothetical protein